MEMDTYIWSTLPEDLMKKVLVRLPLSSLARARMVCKKWYNMVQTPHFLHLRREVHSLPEACVFLYWERENGEVSIYNPALRKWRTAFSISFVPHIMSVPPVAAVGGIFCFACTNTLLVCNFLTHKWRLLPPLIGFKPSLNPWTFAHLVLEHDRLSYKVNYSPKHSLCTSNTIQKTLYNTQIWLLCINKIYM